MKDPVSPFLYKNVRPYIRPYILVISQWQRWNLFSPNPLRRVKNFAVDMQKEDEMWEELITISPDTVEWWRRSPELKIMRRLSQKSEFVPIQEQYLLAFCTSLHLPPETILRLREREYTISKLQSFVTGSWWKDQTPYWKEEMNVYTSCPPAET